MEELQSYILSHPRDKGALDAYEELMKKFREMHVGAAAVAAGEYAPLEVGDEKSPIS